MTRAPFTNYFPDFIAVGKETRAKGTGKPDCNLPDRNLDQSSTVIVLYFVIVLHVEHIV
jgi:hypothetical protein